MSCKGEKVRALNVKEVSNMVFSHATSWGVSTRLIGALIMAHSDDDGLILPPKIAPEHVVIIPIYKTDEEREAVLSYVNNIKDNLKKQRYDDEIIRVEIDDRDTTSGEKNWFWIKKGVPIRIEIGPRDIQNNSVFMARRDKSPKEKESLNKEDFISRISAILYDIQNSIYNNALSFIVENTIPIDTKDEFYKYFTPKNKEKPEIHGGFALSHWCESLECEDRIKEDLKVTIRCIPNALQADKSIADLLAKHDGVGECIICSGNSKKRVVFAKSY